MTENKKMVMRKYRSGSLKDAIDALLRSTDPMLSSAKQIENIVANLREVVDELAKNFASAKSLILELARRLDETKQCKQSQICIKIKQMLADKIQEGKITEKWVERCLPQEYKRRYAKSEQGSLSKKAKKLEKIVIDNKGKAVVDSSAYNSSTIDNSAFTQSQGGDTTQTIQKEEDVSENGDDGLCTRSQKLKEAPRKASVMREAEHLSGAEIKFTIPKERYEEVKTAMCNGSNCCYLIFDRNSGLLLRSEANERGD